MHGEHDWAHIRDKNLNTQLIMDFSDFLIIIFTEKCEKLEM